MKKQTIFPITVMPAVPDKEGIRFLPYANQSWIVDNHVNVIWTVLRESRGVTTLNSVVTAVSKEHPKVKKEIIREIIDHLLRLGVLIDRPEAFRAVLPLITNPSYVLPLMTRKEVMEYTKSSRVAVKKGRTYKLTIKQNNHPLTGLQAFRRSCRSFKKDKNISFDSLSNILTHTYSLQLHATPSGGALYPLKLFVILTRDQYDLPEGYYEYDPERHELNKYGILDKELLQYIFAQDALLHNAPVIVVIAADLKRQARKYGNRAYLLSALEAGLAAQNMHMAAASEQINTLQYGGFTEKTLATELRMNEGTEIDQVLPLTTVALGYADESQSPDLEALLDKYSKQLVGKGKPVKKLSIIYGYQRSEGNDFFGAHAYARRPNNDKAGYVAAGTATTTALAQIKALAEAYERYASGTVRVDRTAKGIALTKANEQWMDPRIVAPMTKEQLAHYPDMEQFDENKSWQWVKGNEASTNKTVWVPVDLVYYPLFPEIWGRKRCSNATSSGVAAYSDESEAIRRAVFELLERHATMDDWLRHEPFSPIATEKLPYHYQRRVAYWKQKGYQVYVLDMTDRVYGMIGINVVLVSDSFPCFMSGAAVSDSFEAALSKAFHESEIAITCIRKPKKGYLLRPHNVKTIADHALFYAQPEYVNKVKWLWSGKEAKKIPVQTSTITQVLKELNAVIVKVSPPDAPFVVMRVLSERLIPISFGYGNDHYIHNSLKGAVKVEDLQLPHYFA
jgi:thiazole/oxazole-forming peptide maturase SagD family component